MSCGMGPEARHDWEPLHGWTGRYRCRFCYAIGHKHKLVIEPHGVHYSDSIVPYACTRKDCHQHAVQRKPQLCATHESASRARRSAP